MWAPSNQRRSFFIFVFFTFIVMAGCNSHRINQNVLDEINAHRREVDSSFQYDPNSPFHSDSSAHFDGIKWFPPDEKYIFTSKLHRYAQPETVTVLGTKGEERKEIKYGYFILKFEGTDHHLNAYKFGLEEIEQHPQLRNRLSVWFTDETTGKETYGVGRYIEVDDLAADTNYIYTLNLNNAYNPYCAYSPMYSCAIPRKEDHLPFPVKAGEMKYHE
jgi:uncharacterized protein (DUF1684 family)